MLAHRILVANAVLGGSLISVVRKFLLRWGDLRVSHESHDLLSLNTCRSLGSSGHDVLLDGSGVLVCRAQGRGDEARHGLAQRRRSDDKAAVGRRRGSGGSGGEA